MAKPNFFIVGAPKCGTTSLYTYLKQHPDIFMPAHKEPHYFASDLDIPAYAAYQDEAYYLKLFHSVTSETRSGEASVWYLYSDQAAQRIQTFDPQARILIMLRNPVDLLYSLHAQLVYGGDEPLESFAAALGAEASRKSGQMPRPQTRFAPYQALYYHDVIRFTEPITRYFTLFGREAVKVILMDDLKRDTAGVYREVLEFLGVDPDFKADFKVANPNTRVHNRQLFNFFIGQPPHWYKAHAVPLVKRILPPGTETGVNDQLRKLHSRAVPREPLDAALQAELRARFRPEVDRLSQLLDRDLSEWYGAD